MQRFAEKALDGLEVRWTSNPVERAITRLKSLEYDTMESSATSSNSLPTTFSVQYDYDSRFRGLHEQPAS